jgi:hypothetical protein
MLQQGGGMRKAGGQDTYPVFPQHRHLSHTDAGTTDVHCSAHYRQLGCGTGCLHMVTGQTVTRDTHRASSTVLSLSVTLGKQRADKTRTPLETQQRTPVHTTDGGSNHGLAQPTCKL